MADLHQQLTELIAKGEKIAAIRLLREHYGIGLAEAKTALERFESGGGLPPERSAIVDLPEDVRALAGRGLIVESIKLLRERTGMDLTEAKRLVDSVGGRSKKSGCGAALIFVALGCAGLAVCV